MEIADLNSTPNANLSNPLCFLPPDTAYQMLVARYVVVGTLSVFIWELLNDILNDYKILSEHRIGLPTIVYFLSRLFCLAFCISTTIFETVPLPSCYPIEKSIDVFFSLTVVLSSLLFFLRIRAVFNENPWITALFAGLFLSVVGGCTTLVIGVSVAHLGPTRYCVIVEVKPFAEAASIIPLINDTFVFFAMTWRLSRNSYTRRTLEHDVRMFVFGDYLPIFSKAMLQDGQAYYLTSVASNLVTVIMLNNHSVPGLLRTVITVPNAALTNIMACRVFKNTLFGVFREKQISTALISTVLRQPSVGRDVTSA